MVSLDDLISSKLDLSSMLKWWYCFVTGSTAVICCNCVFYFMLASRLDHYSETWMVQAIPIILDRLLLHLVAFITGSLLKYKLMFMMFIQKRSLFGSFFIFIHLCGSVWSFLGFILLGFISFFQFTGRIPSIKIVFVILSIVLLQASYKICQMFLNWVPAEK